jgi:hypothetical protein
MCERRRSGLARTSLSRVQNAVSGSAWLLAMWQHWTVPRAAGDSTTVHAVVANKWAAYGTPQTYYLVTDLPAVITVSNWTMPQWPEAVGITVQGMVVRIPYPNRVVLRWCRVSHRARAKPAVSHSNVQILSRAPWLVANCHMVHASAHGLPAARA